MQYMIVERFYPSKVKAMYQRFAEKGRMMPDGVSFINSWINESITVCYQLMEAESLEKLQAWIDNWKEFADFEVIPVISSAEAKQKILDAGS
ncbi:MAG: DUF3303 domain-containing protein [Bacteroidetes bacterium]|jgi:uncharacterized protein YjaG (DUF416 family)|nr:MAG: DUF3303 domain-containing protein [Bacteroidota bacterium]